MLHICTPRAPIRCHAVSTLRASQRRMAQHDNFFFVYQQRTTICFAGSILLLLLLALTSLGTQIKRQRHAWCAYPCTAPFLTCLGRFDVNVAQDLVGRLTRYCWSNTCAMWDFLLFLVYGASFLKVWGKKTMSEHSRVIEYQSNQKELV